MRCRKQWIKKEHWCLDVPGKIFRCFALIRQNTNDIISLNCNCDLHETKKPLVRFFAKITMGCSSQRVLDLAVHNKGDDVRTQMHLQGVCLNTRMQTQCSKNQALMPQKPPCCAKSVPGLTNLSSSHYLKTHAITDLGGYWWSFVIIIPFLQKSQPLMQR